MAIAKHLTEQMSGRISFESEENVGTTFHLEFPLAKSDADAA
jgi:signal transduction histidine kinase